SLWVDRHFFEIFDFELLAREGPLLLDKPNELVLTRSTADLMFPQLRGNYQQMLGQELSIDRNENTYKVVGICENLPANSTLHFQVLGSYNTLINAWGPGVEDSWTWSDFYHFLELAPGTDVAALEARFDDFSERHFRGNEVTGSEEVFTLQAFKDTHLNSSDMEYEIGRTNNGRAVFALLIIAFFVLIIAWVNYVNLSSVRAIERAKEVGVRKAIGATRGQLVRQFLAEALSINLISLGLAVLTVQLMGPWLANQFGLAPGVLSISGLYQFNSWLLGGLFVLILLGVLVSGAYPAWLLSSPHVSSVLKGIFTRDLRGTGLRRGLVVFQFTISIALIAATWLVSKQISYMSKQDLGINIDQVMILQGPDLARWDSTFIDRMNSFKGALEQYPGVLSAATSNRTPGERMGRQFNIRRIGAADNGQKFTSNSISVDFEFAETYSLAPVEGRFFRREDHNYDYSQINNLLLNESAARNFGFSSPADAVGQQLLMGDDRNWNIIGVLPDFHQRSLRHAIEPIVFLPLYSTGNAISIKMQTGQIDATIAQVRLTYSEFFPDNPFLYTFADENFQRLYESDQQFSGVLSFFTLMTILIAIFGLFGLA
ncbi:MAG: ABC transporter permease, partial [Bacteroidota bacterium]